MADYRCPACHGRSSWWIDYRRICGDCGGEMVEIAPQEPPPKPNIGEIWGRERWGK